MTVAALPSLVEYVGNGVSVAFAAPFRYLASANLQVTVTAIDGTVTTLAHGAGFTATAGTTDGGGTVTLAVAPAVGAVVRIARATPRAQTTDYTTGDDFPAEAHEGALDRVTMIAQEQGDEIADVAARSLMVPIGEVAPALPPLATLENSYLFVDGDGNVIGSPGVAGLALGAVSVEVFTQKVRLAMNDGTGRYVDLPWQVEEPVMWDRSLWTAQATGLTNIRMGLGAFLNTSTAHVFACEHGGAALGENGFRAAWRSVAFDFDGRDATPSAVTVLDQPAGWPTNGYSGTFSAWKIETGPHAGKIEVLWNRLVPDTVPFGTAGTQLDTIYANSSDNYATKTVMIDGLDFYIEYPTVPAPLSQKGAFVLPQGHVEIPAGEANAGRRIVVLGINDNRGYYTNITLSCEQTLLFKDGFTYGEIIPQDAAGVQYWNETSLAYQGGQVHAITRIEDADGAPNYLLTNPGFLHSTSTSGVAAWAAAIRVSGVAFGNVQLAALGLVDSDEWILVAGSTSPTAGVRDEMAYAVMTAAGSIIGRINWTESSTCRGYGKLVRHVDGEGREWFVHFYEQCNGRTGFNDHGGAIRVRVFNRQWILDNLELI